MSDNNNQPPVKISRETADAVLALLSEMPINRGLRVWQMFAGDLADKKLNAQTDRERMKAGE